jgi:hypothetical protein
LTLNAPITDCDIQDSLISAAICMTMPTGGTAMFRLAAILCLAAAPAWATPFACGEWPAAERGEGGPISVTLRDNELIWSNGQATVIAEAVRNFGVHRVFLSDESVYLALGANPGFREPTHIRLRRIRLTEYELISAVDCYRQ